MDVIIITNGTTEEIADLIALLQGPRETEELRIKEKTVTLEPVRCTRMEELRTSAGLSQGKVAKELGITDAAVSMWETGKTRPRASLLVKLATLYGCTVDELLAEDAPSVSATPPERGN